MPLKLTLCATHDTTYRCPRCREIYRYDYETAKQDGDTQDDIQTYRKEAREHAEAQHAYDSPDCED